MNKRPGQTRPNPTMPRHIAVISSVFLVFGAAQCIALPDAIAADPSFLMHGVIRMFVCFLVVGVIQALYPRDFFDDDQPH